MLSAVIAAIKAAAPALATAAPVAGAAAFSVAIISAHDPAGDLSRTLEKKPEAATECMRRNVEALQTQLVLAGRPLYGTEVYGFTLKRGVTGEPLMTGVLKDSGSGSTAEFTPLAPREQLPDILERMVAGC